MRPLIGITTSELRPSRMGTTTRHGEPPHPEMALGITYARAVEAAGGVPVVLPPVDADAVGALVARLDGLVLSGGPDLDPTAYGAQPHLELGETAPRLDRFEYDVAREAMGRGVPLLAICRGMQALNVVRGGTLHQHVPDVVGTGRHRQTEHATRCTHDIAIETGTLLHRLCGGADRRGVNSFHHQAVDRPGAGVRVVARADDGLVEAIDLPAFPFVLGVQWHAEALAQDDVLFAGLVDAARATDPVALPAAA